MLEKLRTVDEESSSASINQEKMATTQGRAFKVIVLPGLGLEEEVEGSPGFDEVHEKKIELGE